MSRHDEAEQEGRIMKIGAEEVYEGGSRGKHRYNRLISHRINLWYNRQA